MALDHPEAVASLAVLDIVPTHAMFMETDRHRSQAYWHWYFLAQPAPFPERLIGADPDFFFETCLVGWGKTRLEDFDQEMLADYRRCWRDPEMIHATCADYRAGATIDLEHDAADIERKVTCPTLAFWGSNGLMHKLWDIEAKWRERCGHVRPASLAGGHFFIEQFPQGNRRPPGGLPGRIDDVGGFRRERQRDGLSSVICRTQIPRAVSALWPSSVVN